VPIFMLVCVAVVLYCIVLVNGGRAPGWRDWVPLPPAFLWMLLWHISWPVRRLCGLICSCVAKDSHTSAELHLKLLENVRPAHCCGLEAHTAGSSRQSFACWVRK
jgi:hypothetical protein